MAVKRSLRTGERLGEAQHTVARALKPWLQRQLPQELPATTANARAVALRSNTVYNGCATLEGSLGGGKGSARTGMVQEASGAVSLLQQLRADKADLGGSVIVDTKRQAAVVHTAQLQSTARRHAAGGKASKGPLLLHVVRGPPKLRAGVESESKKLGFLRIGDVIEVLETKVNDRGQTRVRCAAGWVSLTAKDGSRLLVEDQHYERAPALSEQLAGSGVVYRCIKKAVLRSGMDKLSERLGSVEEGTYSA